MAEDQRSDVEEVLAQYQGPEHAALRDLIAGLVTVIGELAAKVAQLEADAKRHSGNSSKPPSADTLAQRQAQNARRDAWTNKGKANFAYANIKLAVNAVGLVSSITSLGGSSPGASPVGRAPVLPSMTQSWPAAQPGPGCPLSAW